MSFSLRAALGVCAVIFAAPTFAQEAALSLTSDQQRNVDRLIDRALEDDLAWDVLESLTTEIGPRLGGSDAEARARDWGAEKLQDLGFKNVRIETFEMPYWERVKEHAEITAPFAQPLSITALGQSPSTPEDGIEGAVVRFETLLDLETAPEGSLAGKIAFVDEPMARTQDGSGYGLAVQKRSRSAQAARDRGALAVLIRSVGTDSHRMPHTGSSVRGGGSLSPLPAAALSNPDADQLARALKLADDSVTVKLSIEVEWREATTSGNVIGEIPGETDELIVIGGHLDSWDLGTGAVDDGAGIAITTAAAKLVGDLRGKPKRTIRVVMWGSEEVGLHGARAYAEMHEDELDRHVLASESDFGAGRVYQFDTRFAEDALPKGAVIADGLRRLSIARGHNFAFGGPDVLPIRDLGVPVVSLRQSGWDYFDLHHTGDDTLDKVDPEDLRQNVAAWAAMIYMASELPGGFREEAE